MSSDLRIKQIAGRLSALDTVLKSSIETNVATLTTQLEELSALASTIETSMTQTVTDLTEQINTLNTKIEDIKTNAHYLFSVVGEAEGSFNDPAQILPIAFGSGTPSDVDFGLVIPVACYVKHLNISSSFGPNEVAEPQMRFQLDIYYNGSRTMTYSYPGAYDSFHTKTSSQDTYLPIQAGSVIYLTCPSSNLVDASSRHRFSIYFQNNYLVENLWAI
jgi:hypothetical protein